MRAWRRGVIATRAQSRDEGSAREDASMGPELATGRERGASSKDGR